MKITDIRTAQAPCFYVRVYTDEGLVGTGECVHGGTGAAEIIHGMKRLLVGEDPLDVDRLFEKVRRAYIFDGALAGYTVTALTGIEIALWDLAGKALGLPVYRLLGGLFRDRIRLYCDCHAGEDERPTSYAKRAREALEMGFNAIKFDIDKANDPHKLDAYNWTASPGEIHRMVEQVAAIREAIGPEVDLAIDMHGRYDAPAGIQIAQALEPYNLMWLEEPVPPENVDALLEVKRSTRTPICVGENLYLRYGFRDLLEKQAVHVIMPDIPKCGGLSEGRKIANMAEIYYIPIAPHNVSGPLGTIASCHVCATVPNFLVLEWHWMYRPEWNDLVITEEPLIQDGYIRLPDAPGLGVEINEEVARRYMRPGTTFF